MKFTKWAAAAALVAVSLNARADVIDFNGLAGTNMPGNSSYGVIGLYTYFEKPSTVSGYTFNTPDDVHWYAGIWNAIVFCGGSSVDCANNGTDYLLARPHLIVSRSTGGTFNLNALDLDNFYENPADTNFVRSYLLTGTLANGGTVSRTLTLDNIPNRANVGSTAAFNHFTLSEFNNLTQFEIVLNDGGVQGSFALDNLDVTSNVSPVPEPSRWGMLTLGLSGLLWLRGKRRA